MSNNKVKGFYIPDDLDLDIDKLENEFEDAIKEAVKELENWEDEIGV